MPSLIHCLSKPLVIKVILVILVMSKVNANSHPWFTACQSRPQNHWWCDIALSWESNVAMRLCSSKEVVICFGTILMIKTCFGKHRKNCECCPVSQLIVRSQRLSWIQVLNCQNCSQCLKCNKSLGLLLGGVLKMSLSLSLSLYLSLSIFWSCHVFSSLWTNVSEVTSL